MTFKSTVYTEVFQISSLWQAQTCDFQKHCIYRSFFKYFIKIFRETIVSYASAQNLIVVKTLSGCGNAAAEAIDCLKLEHVVGSVAGDNTLLIIAEHEAYVAAILKVFEDMIALRE